MSALICCKKCHQPIGAGCHCLNKYGRRKYDCACLECQKIKMKKQNMEHSKKYKVPKMSFTATELTTEIEEIRQIKKTISILKKRCGERCEGSDGALGCFNCGMWRVIDDLQTWVDLGDLKKV